LKDRLCEIRVSEKRQNKSYIQEIPRIKTIKVTFTATDSRRPAGCRSVEAAQDVLKSFD
jgi:hypothetical protein